MLSNLGHETKSSLEPKIRIRPIYTVLYCNVLYSTVLYCTVLYRTVLYRTVLYYTVLYCTVMYCTVLYCTVLYCTVLYCTILYCTVLEEMRIFADREQTIKQTIREQTDNQTIREQTNREFKNWGHSNPLWSVDSRGAGQYFTIFTHTLLRDQGFNSYVMYCTVLYCT